MRTYALTPVLLPTTWVAPMGARLASSIRRSRFFSARRCDQQADSYTDANSEQQSTDSAEYLRIFLATKRVGGTTDAVGRGAIGVPHCVLDVVHIVRQTLTQGIKQMKSGIKQDVKKWFSLSESRVCVSRRVFCRYGDAETG